MDKAIAAALHFQQSVPTVGTMVLYVQGDVECYPNKGGTNGTREHPAVVTRRFDNGLVSLLVFFDGHGPATRRAVDPKWSAREGASHWMWRDE